MLVDWVKLSNERGVSLLLPATGPGPEGFGLATAAAGALEGWWAMPEPRVELVERPRADGMFSPMGAFVTARTVTLVAHHVGVSPSSESAARDLFAGFLRGWVKLAVSEAGTVRHVWGLASSAHEVTHVRDTVSTHQVVFTCPDPLKYAGLGEVSRLGGTFETWDRAEAHWGDSSRSSGLLFPLADQTPREDVTTSDQPLLLFDGVPSSSTAVCVNAGTADTWPVLEAVGPLSWARFSLGDCVVQYDGDIPAGQTLRIDTRTGGVFINGTRVPSLGLVADDFFSLSPGMNLVAVQADRPADFTVRWLSAWT